MSLNSCASGWEIFCGGRHPPVRMRLHWVFFAPGRHQLPRPVDICGCCCVPASSDGFSVCRTSGVGSNFSAMLISHTLWGRSPNFGTPNWVRAIPPFILPRFASVGLGSISVCCGMHCVFSVFGVLGFPWQLVFCRSARMAPYRSGALAFASCSSRCLHAVAPPRGAVLQT